jgi:hypothetical protein
MISAKRILCLFLFTILLTACGGNSDVGPTTDVDFVLTSGVETMVASFFGTQTALYTPPVATDAPIPLPSPVDTPTLVSTLVPSSTPLTIYYTATANTSTPSPTGTIYTATVDPDSLAVGCNNLALIYDVTIPDGTIFHPGDVFTKTWKVENNGTCDWEYAYRLSFSGGDQLSGVNRRLAKTIVPGKWTEISVKLEAPRPEGTYTGYWRMADAEGNMFGTTLSVTIKVKKPQADTQTPQPTAIPTDTVVPTDTSTPTATPTP